MKATTSVSPGIRRLAAFACRAFSSSSSACPYQNYCRIAYWSCNLQTLTISETCDRVVFVCISHDGPHCIVRDSRDYSEMAFSFYLQLSICFLCFVRASAVAVHSPKPEVSSNAGESPQDEACGCLDSCLPPVSSSRALRLPLHFFTPAIGTA